MEVNLWKRGGWAAIAIGLVCIGALTGCSLPGFTLSSSEGAVQERRVGQEPSITLTAVLSSTTTAALQSRSPSPRDRLQEEDLDSYWAGENFLRTVRPADEAVEYAIEWFMADPPHRNNILNVHYGRIGVGVAEGPPGWYTFVLDFATG